MSIKAEFAKSQREMLSEAIELADAIAAGQTTLRQLTNAACRRLGDQFAAASMVLDRCADSAISDAASPAVIGLYRRFATVYRRHAEQALMICGEFESMSRAGEHVDGIRRMINAQLDHFGIDAGILFEASIQQVDLRQADAEQTCQPAG